MTNNYANWLNTFDWNYFITLRSPYKTNYMTTRSWFNTLFKKQNSIIRAIYATERDKGDWTSTHTHALIASDKDISYKDLSKCFNCSVGDYQIVKDNEGITKYVTKFIGKNIDYDFIGDFTK